MDETQPPRSDLATTAAPSSQPPTQPPSSNASWLGKSRRERLVAGAMVGTRYRIVSPLGRGGMGEVYRADDLELGQSVALKFLPDHLADDAVALDRLRNEVRTARQIAHPNVCRVYDIGNAGRDYFLTMEFVDGEDLASVIRRLGAPGREKSLELSRQICAGLHAAHELGVLHRDLKPANIMLDGRGRARITDFGLAALAADLAGKREHAGTPAYMAPEQLTRGEVSVRSDIYSLGLILIELFTGKSPNLGKSIEQLLQTQQSGSVSGTIATIAREIDPAVERVIEHCVAIDPKDRPSSAMSVVAALPGGDPIAAALAAGETPSPQLIAAAGSAGLLSIRTASLLLGAVLIGLIIHLILGARTRLINQTPLPKSPEVLLDRARELAASFGANPDDARDWAHGFVPDTGYVQYLGAQERPIDEAAAIRKPAPPAIKYWYRQARETLVPRTSQMTTAVISAVNPPTISRGMSGLDLSPDGKLIKFYSIPNAWNSAALAAATQPATQPTSAPAPFDPQPALRAAGFDVAALQSVDPAFTPVIPFDDRLAFAGTYPNSDVAARIEMATYAGKLTSMVVLAPWELPTYSFPRPAEWQEAVGGLFQLLVFGGSGVLIAVNFAQRRGDPRGAMKVAVFIGLIDLLTWVFANSRPGPPGIVMVQFFQAFAFALLLGSLAWSLYMGLEPYIRRRSPHRLVAWSRLLEGRFRDPLVGRDLLIGLCHGAIAVAAVCIMQQIFVESLDKFITSNAGVTMLHSLRPVFDTISSYFVHCITGAMMFLILPLILQTILRSWLAATIVFWLFIAAFVGSRGWDSLIFAAIVWAGSLLALYRYGVVAGAAAIFVVNLLGGSDPPANWSAWYATPGLVCTLAVAALAVFGFYVALGGRSIFASEGFVKA